MKFVDSRNQEHQYYGRFAEVNISSFPFLDIIQQRDLSKYRYEDLLFSGLFQLKVNVKTVGSVVFFFKSESFNKEDFVSLVTPLGDLPSITIGDAINKIHSLYDVAARFNPVFSVYYPAGKCILFPECFETLVGSITTYYVNGYNESVVEDKKPLFFKKKEPKEKVVKEKPAPQPREEKIKEQKVKEPKQPKERTKINFANPFKVIAEDKYHYLFALVAAFLIGFTLDIAIFDIKLGKMIYIFFFICCVIGMVLNCFIYKDTLAEKGFKSYEYIINIAVSLVGVGLSIGGYFIFLSLAKDKPANNPNVALILFAPILALLVSVGISFVLNKFSKKRA